MEDRKPEWGVLESQVRTFQEGEESAGALVR